MNKGSGARDPLTLSVLLVATLFALPALAQQEAAVARIGVLNPQGASTSMEEALRQGLAQLGYVEGRSISIEWRRSADTTEKIRALATDLVNSRVDLIVALGSPATRVALTATSKPVVFLVADPVASGFASSVARPGGNGTGVSVISADLYPKRLELLHQIAPRARRIAYLMNSSNPIGAQSLEETQKAARVLGLQVVKLDARNSDEVQTAIRAIHVGVADAILVSADLGLLAHRTEIAQAVRKAKLPAMFPFKQYHEAGVLISYGPDYDAAMRQVASYVSRVLKGARPSELPIEQASTYELVVNSRLAHELGIQIPQSIFERADEVRQ